MRWARAIFAGNIPPPSQPPSIAQRGVTTNEFECPWMEKCAGADNPLNGDGALAVDYSIVHFNANRGV